MGEGRGMLAAAVGDLAFQHLSGDRQQLYAGHAVRSSDITKVIGPMRKNINRDRGSRVVVVTFAPLLLFSIAKGGKGERF